MTIKGIEQGIRRKVEAKLRERGLPTDRAKTVAEQQHASAVAFFQGRLAAGNGAGELAYEQAFADLGTWAANLKI